MKLFLLDTMSFIYRAYHAAARQPIIMSTKAGFPTGATYIFCQMLRRLLADYKPEYLVAICDLPGETIRDREYVDYKANRRGETPPDLVRQLPKIFAAIEAYGISKLSLQGYEADDLIGTLAKAAYTADLECLIYIVSGDKDMLQLVNERTYVIDPMKNLFYDAAKVEQIVGVIPSQVIDVMALRGDTVDNIPGADGIGKKGSVDIIRQFGSVEQAIAGALEVKRKSYRESLQNNQESIILSKKLVTIRCNAPVDLNIQSLHKNDTNTEKVTALYTELEFASLLKRDNLAVVEDFAEIVTPGLFEEPPAMPSAQADDLIKSLI